jgi:hypothetical protein
MNNLSIYQDNPTSPAAWRGLSFPRRAGYATSMNPRTTKIIRELEKVSAIGADNNTIFDDWLEITLATLEARRLT